MMPSIKRKGMARPSPSPEASRRHALWLGLRFGRRRWQRQQLARIGGIGIVGQQRRRDGCRRLDRADTAAHRVGGGRERHPARHPAVDLAASVRAVEMVARSEEHTSELQSLMRISYAVFCLKKKTYTTTGVIVYKPPQ